VWRARPGSPQRPVPAAGSRSCQVYRGIVQSASATVLCRRRCAGGGHRPTARRPNARPAVHPDRDPGDLGTRMVTGSPCEPHRRSHSQSHQWVDQAATPDPNPHDLARSPRGSIPIGHFKIAVCATSAFTCGPDLNAGVALSAIMEMVVGR
jgi:hypothetical protein